jgi:hypothetical protein
MFLVVHAFVSEEGTIRCRQDVRMQLPLVVWRLQHPRRQLALTALIFLHARWLKSI